MKSILNLFFLLVVFSVKAQVKLDSLWVFGKMKAGPVTSGIEGKTKYHYDIWGDAVNTASRVENAGEVGKVNISQSTYEQIKNDPNFRFQPRGKNKSKRQSRYGDVVCGEGRLILDLQF